MGDKNAEIFVQNEYTQCLLLYVVNIVIAAQSAQYNKLCEILLDCEPPAKIVYQGCRSRCSKFRPQKVDREKLSHRVDRHRLVYTIIVLMVNIIGSAKVNLLILKQLHKSEQRINDIFEE